MERLTPEKAAIRLKVEDHVTIIFEKGYEKNSQTAEEFEGIYGSEKFESVCFDALFGEEFRFETFLSNDQMLRKSVQDVVLYGEWHYIILHDQNHPTDDNKLVMIANELTTEPSDYEYEEKTVVADLSLSQRESYSVLSMVQDCIDRGMISSRYDVNRIEELLKKIEDPFEDFQKDLEFEIQVTVRKKKVD